MRRLILLPLIFLTNGLIFAQTDRLSLTTKITDQKYCGGDYSDMAMLRMSLRLTYRNETSKTLILYKGSNLISYVLIAKDAPQIRNKQYEMNMHVGWITSEGKLREGDQPGNELAVLQPGDIFETKGDINVPVALEPGTQFVKSGDHVLQVVIETWHTDETSLDRLRKKWERTGYLWGDNIRSDPVPFTVAIKPNVVQCK
jgi:hypothetical protein